MGINFPNTPSEGAIFQPIPGGIVYKWSGGVWRIVSYTGTVIPDAPSDGKQYARVNGAWNPVVIDVPPAMFAPRTATPNNLIVNPIMQVSQENGDTASANATTLMPGYFAADQWRVSFILGGNANAQRKQDANKKDYVNLSIVVATAALAGGQFASISEDLEGYAITALGWQSAVAAERLDAVLRFRFYCDVAGTYSFFIWNAAANGSYVKNFGAVAGWQDLVFVVPAAPDAMKNTWLSATLNQKAATVGVCVAASQGSSYQGSEGWNASAKYYQGYNASNGAATVGNFGLTDVGLYPDPDKSGKPPPLLIPGYGEVLDACLRYYHKLTNRWVVAGWAGVAGQSIFAQFSNPVPTRATPTVSSAVSGLVNTTGITFTATGNDSVEARSTGTAIGQVSAVADALIVNARM